MLRHNSEIAFSIAMQESLGSVRPYNGDDGKSHGLFQLQHQSGATGVYDAATCFSTPVGHCSAAQIQLMARQGICGFVLDCGAPSRPGIAAYWRQFNGSVGLVARAFNSGSIYDDWDLTVTDTGTNSYASDIVNRAVGAVTGGFFARTCCASCTAERMVIDVRTCGPEDEGRSDFCGDERSSFHGGIG